jgi:replicative DNA helicase
MQRQALLEGTRNSLDILIAKNRNGPTDNITLFADMGCNVVRDAA